VSGLLFRNQVGTNGLSTGWTGQNPFLPQTILSAAGLAVTQ